MYCDLSKYNVKHSLRSKGLALVPHDPHKMIIIE